MMADFNAKVGCREGHGMVGNFGLGVQNERGERWSQWCSENNQVFTNTWFQEHPRRRWTWKSPGGETKNQIDYITINRRFRRAVQQPKAYPGADCGSNHCPVICTLKVKLKKVQRQKIIPKLDYESLLKCSEIKESYAIAVKNRFEALANDNDNERVTTWHLLKEALVTTAEEVIPKKGVKN